MTRTQVLGRARLLAIGTAVGLVLSMAGASVTGPAFSAAGHTDVSVVHETVDGIFRGYPGDCPDELPATPLVCHEWDLTVYRNGFNDHPGGLAPPKHPWVLIALRHTLTFAGGDVEPVESEVGFGFRDGVDVTFDRTHLGSATVRAHDLALTDGTTVDLDATWTATSDLFRYGNDGPALVGPDNPRHFHADCITLNNDGHQVFRTARVDAVVNGIASNYSGAYGFLSTGHYTLIEVHPHSCG